MDHAKAGSDAVNTKDFTAAVAHYTRALIEHPTSPDYFTQRSTAFTRLEPPQHELALRDAEIAVLLGRKRQKRDKIQAAQQRRVVSLYNLGYYEEAKTILDTMLKWRPKDDKKEKMQHDIWNAKIESKLKGKAAAQVVPDLMKEYPDVELLDERPMKEWLQNQLKNDGTFKFDGDEDTTQAAGPSGTTIREDKDKAQETAEIEAAKAELAAAASNQVQQQAPRIQPIRHDWYQDNNNVTVSFYAKKVDKTKLQSTFTDDHVEIAFPHPDAAEELFTFQLDPTFASIDTSNSVAKAFGAKVELKLAKKEKGVKWPALDDKDRPKKDKLPSAWTTKGDQDWDKKAAELTKKPPKKDKKEGDDGDSDADSEYGGDAVDGFFKKLYAGADEDTRRAMMKSFQESNGTSLSTNWSEVSKGKVEEVKSKDS